MIAAANGVERTGRALWHGRVDQTPDLPFLYCEGRSWSFGEFDLELRRLAAGLAANGVGPGDLVLIGMGNRHEALLSELAIAELGAVFVPLLPGLGFDELAFPINHSEAKLLIADGEAAGPLLPRIDELRWLERMVVTAEVEDETAGVELLRLADLATADPLGRVPLPGHDEDALAAVLYTSGSTGRPKGVMLRARLVSTASAQPSRCASASGPTMSAYCQPRWPMLSARSLHSRSRPSRDRACTSSTASALLASGRTSPSTTQPSRSSSPPTSTS